MSRATFALALLAAAAAVYAAVEAGSLGSRLDALAQAQAQDAGRLAQLGLRVDALTEDAGDAWQPLSAPGTPAGAGAADDAPVGLSTRPPAGLAERLKALAERVDAQQATIARLEEEARAREALPAARGRVAGHDFFFSLDQAASALGLDGRQKADMQDILDRARRDLDDVFRIPNEDGELWEEISKPRTTKIGGTDGAISLAFPDVAKIQKFKKGRIPGLNETYEQAEKRIREDAFGRARGLLDPKQQEQWDRAQKDPLLANGPTGGSVISFATATRVEVSEEK